MSAALKLQGDRVPHFGNRLSARPCPDVDLAKQVISAMQGLEAALNAASLAGFQVEPGFRRVSRRLNGVDESYVAELRVFRPARDAGSRRRTVSPTLTV